MTPGRDVHPVRTLRAVSRHTWALAAVLLALPAAGCEVSLAREDELGDRFAEAILQELPTVPDTAITGAVTRIGRRIIRAADADSRDWHFYVVDDTVVNAFAVPGGHIFVNRGLIEAAGTYSELASVVGHEIAHVTLRHSVEQMRAQQQTNLIVAVVCSVVDLCGSTAAQVVIGMGGQVLFAKYSRDDEVEADSAAVAYLARAGIDPRGVPGMFRRLMARREVEPSALMAWFGSHPAEEDRVARTSALAAALTPTAVTTPSDEAAFAELQRRVASLGH